MPELTPEYRAHLRQNAEEYGDPVIVQLLNALEEAEGDIEALEGDLSAVRTESAHLNGKWLAAESELARVKSELREENINASALIQRAIDVDRRVDHEAAEVRRLNAIILDVHAALDFDDEAEPEHEHGPGDGWPECGACVVQSVRRALGLTK